MSSPQHYDDRQQALQTFRPEYWVTLDLKPLNLPQKREAPTTLVINRHKRLTRTRKNNTKLIRQCLARIH
mgnify:CR=1 FL=1